MITTRNLLNRLMVEKQLHSLRDVARFLDITHSTVHKWHKGGTMSDDIACEVAEILGLDVDLTLLAIIAERSKNNRAIDALRRLEENQKIA
ncbi:helix-turn-helix domain-containing protein [Vibrio sp. LQ2]|uniref:helix-turn-helix domain-containing protein n=1 Tax=Vibrio sp. LQ2 TaxID=2883075 RepID=UPI00208F0083|nr:helix-turn-helix transcriptional regulator [Vibrio sp. LQ2]USP05717.1 helix-turn-helix domain-containing protein [Vibrio sp. LQ2]